MKKAPVSVRAVIQRINRKLAADGKVLKVARPNTLLKQNYGRPYYIVAGNEMKDWRVDVEALGRKLGALAKWEILAAD